MFGKVSRDIRRKLETFDESGMGYWLVTALLRDGRGFGNVAIVDNWRVGFPGLCPFLAQEIIDVAWDGHRGSKSSGQPVLLPPLGRGLTRS